MGARLMAKKGILDKESNRRNTNSTLTSLQHQGHKCHMLIYDNLKQCQNIAGLQSLTTSPHIQQNKTCKTILGSPAGTQDETRFGRAAQVTLSARYREMFFCRVEWQR